MSTRRAPHHSKMTSHHSRPQTLTAMTKSSRRPRLLSLLSRKAPMNTMASLKKEKWQKRLSPRSGKNISRQRSTLSSSSNLLVAKPGKIVWVRYVGHLHSNNKTFERILNGFLGLTGMKVSGKRRITCPPHMA